MIFYLAIMVRTLKIFPLETNLTKWLSKCDGSLQKGKEKKTIIRWQMMQRKLRQGISKEEEQIKN